jgi:hypothetical protein
MPIQTIGPMIFATCVSLIIWILITAGCFFILMKLQKWYTLLMITGAVFSLLILTISTTIGFLQMTEVISVGTYESSSSVTFALRIIGNLCFAIGFAATSIHLMRFLTPIKARDSLGN